MDPVSSALIQTKQLNGLGNPAAYSLLQATGTPPTDFLAALTEELEKQAVPEATAAVQQTSTPEASSNDPAASVVDYEGIHEAAVELESFILYMLLKQMWASIPKSELLPQGLADQFFREMWLEEIADEAARQGSGFGIAEVVERELVQNTSSISAPPA